MLRIISRTALVLAALVLAAPSVMIGCGAKSAKTKGGGVKGAVALSDGQLVGAAKGNESKGKDLGATYEQVTCDDSAQGIGWCDDDGTIIFCDGGHVWAVECADVDGGFCGEDIDLNTVDCYVLAEFN